MEHTKREVWTAQRKLSLDIAIHNHIVRTGDKANREELRVIREMVKAIPEVSVSALSASPDLYEALKEVKLVWPGLDPNIKFPHLNEVIQQALAKAEGK